MSGKLNASLTDQTWNYALCCCLSDQDDLCAVMADAEVSLEEERRLDGGLGRLLTAWEEYEAARANLERRRQEAANMGADN